MSLAFKHEKLKSVSINIIYIYMYSQPSYRRRGVQTGSKKYTRGIDRITSGLSFPENTEFECRKI